LAGAYQLYIGCAPGKVAEAKKELLRVLENFSRTGIPAEELRRAKTYMIGLYQVGLQSNRSQVLSYGRYALSGLGAATVERIPAVIQKITAGEVQAAVRRYLQTREKTWVLLAPKSRA
jgi:predicted Zn-dependent peptidase